MRPGIVSAVLAPFISLMLAYAYFHGRTLEELPAGADAITGEPVDAVAHEPRG